MKWLVGNGQTRAWQPISAQNLRLRNVRET
jgi:hypothetical protein